MKRLFIAMPAGEEARASLSPVLAALSPFSKAMKIVSPGNYHITLKFFGETGEDEKIRKGFDALSFPYGPVEYLLRGLGAFPGLKNPSVIWCGMKFKNDDIFKIHELTEEFASGFGYEKEKREFRPHLTLARLRKNETIPGTAAGYIQKNSGTVYAETRFLKIVLCESTRTPRGPVYAELSEKILDVTHG